MTNQHPIQPSPELVEQWDEEGTNMFRPAYQTHLCTRAAQWGANQELEACCEWLDRARRFGESHQLRLARRPKPPSLKQQALEQLDEISTCFRITHMGDIVCDKIRRALEALPND